MEEKDNNFESEQKREAIKRRLIMQGVLFLACVFSLTRLIGVQHQTVYSYISIGATAPLLILFVRNLFLWLKYK